MQSKENSTSKRQLYSLDWRTYNGGYQYYCSLQNRSCLDLINDQLGDVTAEIRNTYKQKNSFETELK
jgi:hypothetical protein